MLSSIYPEPDYIDSSATCNMKLARTIIEAGLQHDMALQNEKGDSEESPQMVQYQIKINQFNFHSTEILF